MTKDIDSCKKFLTQERHDIHLIGVAGSGMSAICGRAFLQLGHTSQWLGTKWIHWRPIGCKGSV